MAWEKDMLIPTLSTENADSSSAKPRNPEIIDQQGQGWAWNLPRSLFPSSFSPMWNTSQPNRHRSLLPLVLLATNDNMLDIPQQAGKEMEPTSHKTGALPASHSSSRVWPRKRENMFLAQTACFWLSYYRRERDCIQLTSHNLQTVICLLNQTGQLKGK